MRNEWLSRFEAAAKSYFLVRLGEHSLPLELAEVNDRGSTHEHRRFSLLFVGPVDGFLPQQTYLLHHDELGELSMFLVPVGQDAEGYRYEALFNS